MASLHHHTPSLAALNPRGACVRKVAYHRVRAEEAPVARVTRSVFGHTGFLQEQWDPRLHTLHATDAGIKPNFSQRLSLSGQVLRNDSVDAGWRVSLLGSAGQPVKSWDARGGLQRHEYDRMLRQVAVFEQAQDDPFEACIEHLTYAGATPEYAALNCSGRLLRHDDPAGSVRYEHYGLNGAVTQQSRRFVKAHTALNWPALITAREQLLAQESFTSSWHYSALNAVREQVDAKGNRRFSEYGIDGELSRITLQFSSGKRKVLVDSRVYNAQGQVISERAGNGAITMASHHEADGRLQQMKVYQSHNRGRVLQDLTYSYDRTGNVISIQDAAQPTAWFSNAKIDAVSQYEYDTLYQLTKATGRENVQNNRKATLPGLVLFGATQNTPWGNYTRHYHYDAAGNLLQMQHVPSTGQGYTQRMNVAAHSNHSLLETPNANPGLGRGFDQGGNQHTLARGQVMSWSLRNQLSQVTQVLREDGECDEETYTYDGAGQRVLKRRLSKAKSLTHTREVMYLPGLELRRDHASEQWLSVLCIETGRTTVRALQWEQHRPAQTADEQVRFSLSDLSGSCTLELDEQAALLNHEGYYPYGATAWWAAKSAIEATYNTHRYSGKERDATGLYYYGYRYYAPWLRRWLNPDPGGTVDGLNGYGFVGNDPIGHVDTDGQIKRRADGSLIPEAAGSESLQPTNVGGSRPSSPARSLSDFDTSLFSPAPSPPPSPAPSLSDFDETLLPTLSLQEQYAAIVETLAPVAAKPQPGTSTQGTFKVPAAPKEKRFKCSTPDCNKSFFSNHNLIIHTRVHTGEAPYACAEPGCTKTFKQAGNLKRHQQTHTGEKPYACSEPGCAKNFALKEHLRLHQRTHTGEKPYSCPEPGCTKSFADGSNLKKHQSIHTQAPRFWCNTAGCHRTFTLKGSLTRHKRKSGH